jgi:hypothetical protein
MANWLYEKGEITDISQFKTGAVGFIYKITNNTTGKFYIGKKILENRLSKKLTKKEILEWNKPGRIPKKKVEKKESNWINYWGSSKTLLADLQLQGKGDYTREILRVCSTRKELSYYEVYYQIKLEVLHIDTYNDNIAGKWFRKDAVPIA